MTRKKAVDAEGAEHHIAVNLDALLADRGMTLTELAERVGVTIVNLSVLKNGRARAIRFTTLSAICRELGCKPGDILDYADQGSDRTRGRNRARTGVE